MKEEISEQILHYLQKAIALELWHTGAIMVDIENPYRLVSGNYSPIYINCRALISSSVFQDLFVVTSRLVLSINQVNFDIVAGGETAGIPFAAFLSRSISRPMIYVRKAEKTHGISSRIEGKVEKGDCVLLVEDLITDAGSKLSFVHSLSEVGTKVKDILVVFDRLQGGKQALAQQNIRLHSLTDMTMVISEAESSALFTDETLKSIREYLTSPLDWHDKRSLQYKS